MSEDRMLSDEILLGIINKKGGGGGGTSNYNDLSNQPQINGNTLVGNKTAIDLGLVAAEAGKGLSSNDYTNEDKAIVGGVTAALAGKQGALTAGDYISIDAQNSISVNRDLVPHQTSYRIKGTGRDTMNITKYIDGVQESSTDYVYSQGTTRTIDDAFTINDTYSSAGYIWQFVWLKDSTTHDKDYIVEYRSYEGAFDFTEVFNDEDLGGYKLVIKSEMDTVLALKQNTLTFDDTPTDNSNNPVKSNGIYDALALKQNATDNSLDTTAKTIVGAINEHEGDIDSLKSGLTNVDVALSVPENTGKNVLPLTLAKIKSLNANMTWVDNVGTIGSNTVTISSDSNGYVSAIKVEGSTQQFIELTNELDSSFNGMILTGCPVGGTGQTYRLLTVQSGTVTSIDLGNGVIVSNLTTGGSLQIRIGSNALPEGGLTFYPMIRPATITDPTFAPYIPSVESRIEAVESGLTNLTNKIKHVFVGGYIAGLALNSGNIGFSVPITGLYTTIVSATQTCTGTIYGSIGAVGSVTFTMASNTLANGVLSFSLTPSVTLSTYTDNAKVLMCEIDKIEFTLS